MLDALKQSLRTWFAAPAVRAGATDEDFARYGFYDPPVETEVSSSGSHAGTTDAFIRSPTLLAAAYIRAGEVARARIVVENEENGTKDESHPISRFLRDYDTALLVESTAHDYYVWGRAYWELNRGGSYDLQRRAQRQLTSITRLEPRKVSRIYTRDGEPPIYQYEGRRIDEAAIVPFERYDNTGALFRLARYLAIELNTLKNREVHSRYGNPRFAYESASYGGNDAGALASDVKRLETRLASDLDRPIVLPLRPQSTFGFISAPEDAEFAQVREVVIQAVSADSGVPAQFLSSEQAFTRWNVVRDARRTLWESHLVRELDRMAAILTNRLLPDDPALRVAFDTSEIEVLGDSREVESKNASAFTTTAAALRTFGFDGETVAEWLGERVGINPDAYAEPEQQAAPDDSPPMDGADAEDEEAA